MHVAIVTPENQTAATGNQVMAGRLAGGLRSHGITSEVLPADGAGDDPSRFDLYHALHAYKAGHQVHRVLQGRAIPFTVACTGTDILVQAPEQRRRQEQIGTVLRSAAGIAVLHEAMRRRIARLFPDCAGRTVVIPQGPALPEPAGTERADWGIEPDAFVFLLPAGLRAVKRPGLALRPLERLRREHPRVRFLLVGSSRDEGMTRSLLAELRHRPWARYLGEVPRAQLVDLYRCADVVLNSSSAEGMPNSLLEAMALGRPVLASRVSGNRALIDHGRDGLLFDSEDDFYRAAKGLIEDRDLRARLGRAGRQKVARRHRPEAELAAYVRLFEGALRTLRPGRGHPSPR